MKKRSKQKTVSLQKSLRQQSMSFSAPAIIRRARTFPILECWISADWQKDGLGLVEILVARQQPDENICFGMYLVDKFCLGLKNTFGRAGYSRTHYENEFHNALTAPKHKSRQDQYPCESRHHFFSNCQFWRPQIDVPQRHHDA